jgi:hypothetical protein
MNIWDYIAHTMADHQIILVVKEETRVSKALEADVSSHIVFTLCPAAHHTSYSDVPAPQA